MSKGVTRFLSLEARQQKQDEARVGTGEEFCLGTFGIQWPGGTRVLICSPNA